MLNFKRFLAAALTALASVSWVSGQSNSSGREMSVEESYLQESIELMIIREQSRSDSRDLQFVALEYIRQAIERGNTSDEIRNALEYLALAGTVNKSRENGRMLNNFPDVRVRAAEYLGDFKTKEATGALIKMILADNEPMVITEAIYSLAKIGINDNEETINAIGKVLARYNSLNPDNRLALAVLNAYDNLAQQNGGLKNPEAVRTIMLIYNGKYIRAVQNRANEVLNNIRKYSAKK
ncbi:hypothetical protein AGMMS49991_00060 [Spirochaetia bacterium]|nr:hypothetical protein AGMMS49991_00060 [Spirochaetia bacterium]